MTQPSPAEAASAASHHVTFFPLLPVFQQRPQWEAAIPGEALDLLGPLVGFLAPDLVSHIHPESLLQHLDELREACLDKGFAKELGRLLVADHALG